MNNISKSPYMVGCEIKSMRLYYRNVSISSESRNVELLR